MSMRLASGGWQSSPLWIPVSVLVALLVGAALIWLTYKLVFARQRLYYSILTTPLVARSAKFAEQLRIYYGRSDDPLVDPRIVRIQMSSRSARDIGRNDFDGQAPLIIKLGSPVIAILTDSGTGSTSPNIAGSGSEVHMQPGLIRRKALITIDVLIAGKPDVSIDSSIRDCEIAERSWVDSSQERSWRERLPPILIWISVAAMILLIAFLVGVFTYKPPTFYYVPTHPAPTVTVTSSASPPGTVRPSSGR